METTETKQQTGVYEFGDTRYVQKPLVIPQINELLGEASSWPQEIKSLIQGGATSIGADAEVATSVLQALKTLLVEGHLVRAMAIVLLPCEQDGKIIPHSRKDKSKIEQEISDWCGVDVSMRIIKDFFIFNALNVNEFMGSVQMIGQQSTKIPMKTEE